MCETHRQVSRLGTSRRTTKDFLGNTENQFSVIGGLGELGELGECGGLGMADYRKLITDN